VEGNVTIVAEQSGNSNYAQADKIVKSFTVNKLNQTIYPFNKIDTKLISTTGVRVVTPLASSLLPVSVTLSEDGIGRLIGNIVELTGQGGTVTIFANQSGNIDYYPATQISTSFKVQKFSQTLSSFSEIPNFVTPISVPFKIGLPFATSNLPVNIYITGGPARLDGDKIVLSGTEGTVYLAAEQSGNGDYYPAESVYASFDVHKIAQYIFIDRNIPDQTPGSGRVTIKIRSSGASRNQVTFKVTGAASGSSGTNIFLNGQTGLVYFTGFQSGNGSFYDAFPVTGSFRVAYKTQTLNDFVKIPPQILRAEAPRESPIANPIKQGPA
jgi:hypothetical protein